MKTLLFLTLFPFISHAKFGKPELIARFMYSGAFNVPGNTWCFSGEPVAHKGRIYLNCLDGDSHLMASWDKEGFKLLARTENDQIFSKPVSAFNRVNWYEFSETSSVRAFSASPELRKTEISNLGPLRDYNDTFLPFSTDSFFFKTKGSTPQLWIWKNNQVTPFFNPKSAYIFSPITGAQGEIVLKTRDTNLDEQSPDRIWIYNGSWKIAFEDQDANPSSPWKTFRHQMNVEGNKILTIARDSRGDALIVIENGKVSVIAREGVELKRFDYFSPKMRAGTIVVRGEDFQGNKAVYVKDNGLFRKILSQGDIIQTDLGPGKVHYQSQDAIFYGAPGLDENGNIYLQATLTDPDFPRTLFGVGLIKFKKE